MDFFERISLASWLKIGLASLLLALGSAWQLYGARLGLPLPPWHAITFGTGTAANRAPLEQRASVSGIPAQHHTHQQQAIAPEGMLDQYVEFNELVEFTDTEIKPDFVLPPAIAPLGILDPAWHGVAP